MRSARWCLLVLLAACGPGPAPTDSTTQPHTGTAIDGIVFVHGISGSGSDWDEVVQHFVDDGWPADRLIARSYEDPKWGSNTSNANQLALWVQELSARGAQHIAVVAHSMGGLSSRFYLQRLGGTSSVETFITLGTMHHGLLSPCLSPVHVKVWDELCVAGTFITSLNSAPATPGPTRWVSMFSDSDMIVSTDSARLPDAQNIEFQKLGHEGLLKSDEVYQRLKEQL